MHETEDDSELKANNLERPECAIYGEQAFDDQTEAPWHFDNTSDALANDAQATLDELGLPFQSPKPAASAQDLFA